MKNSILCYSVGALLYCPANNESIVDSLIHEKFGRHFSLALCLEDTIHDDSVEEAEKILIHTITTLFTQKNKLLIFLKYLYGFGQPDKLLLYWNA